MNSSNKLLLSLPILSLQPIYTSSIQDATLLMGRTAYDYDEHGLKNIQTYIRNFELPKPDYHGENDWLLAIGKMPYNLATDVNKSHQNTLECRHEKWRFLEHIRQVSFDTISPSKCKPSFHIVAAEAKSLSNCLGTSSIF